MGRSRETSASSPRRWSLPLQPLKALRATLTSQHGAYVEEQTASPSIFKVAKNVYVAFAQMSWTIGSAASDVRTSSTVSPCFMES